MQMPVSLARKIEPNCIMISHYFMSAVVCHGVACNMQLDLTLTLHVGMQNARIRIQLGAAKPRPGLRPS